MGFDYYLINLFIFNCFILFNFLLILASRYGYLPIVNSLISANASLDIQDINGYTALIWGSITLM